MSVELGKDADECYRNYMKRWKKDALDIEPRSNLKIVNQVIRAIDFGDIDPDLQLDLWGTPLQERVWNALREIPVGETITYGELANRVDNPNAVRAIGTICGANPIAIIVPCHRVVRADGSDGGYRWGLDIKKRLLDKEYHAAHPMEIVLS